MYENVEGPEVLDGLQYYRVCGMVCQRHDYHTGVSISYGNMGITLLYFDYVLITNMGLYEKGAANPTSL